MRSRHRKRAFSKCRPPRVVGTSSVGAPAERSQRRASMSVVLCRLSMRYDGAVPCRKRNTRTHNRNWIRSGTLSQWSSRSSVLMCACRLTEKTKRAATFKMDCKHSSSLTSRARTSTSRAWRGSERRSLRNFTQYSDTRPDGSCDVGRRGDVSVEVDS